MPAWCQQKAITTGAIIRAMLDGADTDAPAFDPPNADSVYRNYLETCRRAGFEPGPRERAQELMGNV